MQDNNPIRDNRCTFAHSYRLLQNQESRATRSFEDLPTDMRLSRDFDADYQRSHLARGLFDGRLTPSSPKSKTYPPAPPFC